VVEIIVDLIFILIGAGCLIFGVQTDGIGHSVFIDWRVVKVGIASFIIAGVCIYLGAP
jgi:hypothetical protein